MSRYHAASDMLSRAAGKKHGPGPKTLSGHYTSRVTDVVGPLRGRALQFAVLLLHRLVEEYRWAVILAETEGGAVHMTATPWAPGDPADLRGAHTIGKWSIRQRADIMRNIAERTAAVRGMKRELGQIAAAVGRTESWLDRAMTILGKHLESLDEGGRDRPGRGERLADLADPFFERKAPGVAWTPQPLFRDNPDADLRALEDWMRLYKHGPSRPAMRPLRLSDENWRTAKLLDIRIREMRSRSPETWAASLAEKKDENGKKKAPDGPTFQQAMSGLMRACEVALGMDEEMLSREWDALRESGHPEAAHDTVPESLRKVGVRKTEKKGKAYWRSFRKRLKETDFTENVLRNVVRYKRDKLGRFAK